jgi:hypothetical protein
MAETTVENVAEPAVDEQADAARARKKDRANMKKIGGWHAAAVIAALTLFGAAHTWAQFSDWLLAGIVSLAAAFLAGTVLSSIAHEWGHFTGARLSGAVSPVLSKPVRLFFMFRFDMEANSVNQALAMSWGGLIGSWSLVLLLLVLVPLDSWASALLLATVVGRAVNASAFEVPVIIRTGRSGEFEKELNTQLKTTGIVKLPGLVLGGLALMAFA